MSEQLSTDRVTKERHFLSEDSAIATHHPVLPSATRCNSPTAARGLFAFCGLLIVILLNGACSTLPDIRPLMNNGDPGRHGATEPVSSVYAKRGLSAEEEELLTQERASGSDSYDFLDSYLHIMAAAGSPPLVTGNLASLLIDGDVTIVAMLKAIASAKLHINLETYIFKNDDVGRLFADSLLKKRAEGVEVNIIYDAVGSRDSSKSFFDELRRAGIRVVKYNPVFRVPPRSVLRRTHRKLLIVDGTTAFVGGINIGNAFMHSKPPRHGSVPSQPTEYWRDTHLMVEGPVVAEFQELFLSSWTEQQGSPLLRDDYFPDAGQRGGHAVQAVASSPGSTNRLTYVMYLSAITSAKHSVLLTQGYFAPDHRLLNALSDTARRGVDVRLIVPRNSDHYAVQQVSRSHYGRLLRAGVRIYERTGTILHAKTAVIDGSWSTVGSTNLELWSLASTDEVNAVVFGSPFAAEMESLFQEDLGESEEVLLEDWKQRPLLDRASQFFFSLFRYWM